MLKKVIALYVALAIALSGSIAVGAVLISKMIKEQKALAALKAENENGAINTVFHDQAAQFVQPFEITTDDEITIRLRTVRFNVTRAQIQYTADKGVTWTTMDMSYESTDPNGWFDYWTVTLPPQSDFIYYRFMLANKNDSSTVWYDLQNGIEYSEPAYNNGWLLMVGYDSPEWSKATEWYSIVPDAFFNGDTTSDDINTGYASGGRYQLPWVNTRTVNTMNNALASKYGGDLLGIADKVAYLKDLGVSSVFTNPIARAGQNAGYGNETYNEIEFTFGTAATMKQFTNALHENGMHYMMDVAYTFLPGGTAFSSSGYYPIDTTPYKNMWTTAGISAWGGSAIDLGHEITSKMIWTDENSMLQYFVRDMGVDGLRFDCGGWLWGTTDGEDLSANNIILSMKYYLKKINPELFFLSESSGDAAMKTGAFDSQWNLEEVQQIQNYARGLVPANTMSRVMVKTLDRIPRIVALAIYNDTCTHDFGRVHTEEYGMKAAVNLIMTYIGSPCIYYGEENDRQSTLHGSDVGGTMLSMDWDETHWNYDYRNFYKAMLELRNTVSCMRTGSQLQLAVSDDDNLISYARFDKDTRALVAVSNNEDIIEITMDARAAGFSDGETVTDWLTGKEYTVDEEGKVTVSVIPGGSVFCNNGFTSTYRQEYEQYAVGKPDSKAKIYTDNDGAFTTTGKGSIGSKSDDLLFAGVPTYGAFVMDSTVTKAEGETAFMVRDSADADSAFYAATVSNGKVSVSVRTVKGAASKDIASAAFKDGYQIRVVRDGDNTCRTYIADDSGTWTLVGDSAAAAAIGNKCLSGFAPISGTVSFTDTARSAAETVAGADSFDSDIRTALFNNTTASNVSVADGYLTLTSTDEGMGLLNTVAVGDDWTFKTAVKFAPTKEGEIAGILDRGNSREYVAVGRTIVDGKAAIAFGIAHDNEFTVLYSAPDTKPNDDVVLQLQKSGNTYTAIYCYDGINWESVGTHFINANFAEEKVALFVDGKQSASFDYASFGNCLNDGKSTNTPYTPRAIDTNYDEVSEAKSSGTWKNVTGTWEIANEGFVQKDASVLGHAAFTKSNVNSFRMQFVAQIDSGDGFVGFGFGKSKADNASLTDGYLFKYTSDHKIIVLHGSTELANVQLAAPAATGEKVALEVHLDGDMYVQAGEYNRIVAVIHNSGYKGGAMALFTSGVVGHFNNMKCNSTMGNWAEFSGNCFGAGTTIRATAGGVTNLNAVGLSEFVATVKMYISRTSTANAAAQLTLCAPQGTTGEYGGVMITLDQTGLISMRENNQELDTYQLPNVPTSGAVSAYLMITKTAGNYKVYVNSGKEPVFEYSEDYTRGGAFTLSSYASTSKFALIKIDNLTSAQKPETDSEIYKNWMNGYVPAMDTMPTYTQDFSDPSVLDSMFSYGPWVVKDGAISCTSTNAWNYRVRLNDNVYDSFIMSFDVRFDGDASWAAVSFHQSSIDQDHANKGGGVAIHIPSNGGNIFGTNSKDQGRVNNEVYVAPMPDYKKGNWYSLRLEVRKDQVAIYHENTLLTTFVEDEYFEGYIKIASGASLVSFDNISIQALNID